MPQTFPVATGRASACHSAPLLHTFSTPPKMEVRTRLGWLQPSNMQWISALEATQGLIDGFFSQLPYKCYLQKVACVGG